MRVKTLIRRFGADRRGSVAVLATLMVAVIVGFGAFAVDASGFYFQKRRQQSAGDLAALAAAANLPTALAAANATLALDGFGPSALLTLETGTYSADSTLSPEQRFAPQAAGTGNAVRLTLLTTTPTYLGRVFGMSGFSMRTRSVARQANVASFAIGSQLANLDNGLLNAVLGGLLGTNLSLSLMDYQSLANANVDLFAFSNALGTRLNLTAATYGQLASSTVSMGDAVNALADAARQTANGTAALPALSDISGALGHPAPMVGLAPVLNFGPYAQWSLGSSAPLSVSVSALDLISALAQAASGTHQVTASLNVNALGFASAGLSLAIGAQPAGTSFVAVGAQGATVRTAQTRLLLNLQLTPPGLGTLVNLPLYLELAPGTARLSSIACQPGDVTTATVGLDVTPGVVDAWIGGVSNSDFTNLSAPLQPNAAMLLNLGLASVTGFAHANIGNLASTPVGFSYADIQQVVRKTTSTQDFTASLLSSLVGNLQLTVNVVGLGLGVPAGLNTLVATTIANAATPLDQLVSGLLQALGLSLGNATTWVGGVRCGSAVLVN